MMDLSITFYADGNRLLTNTKYARHACDPGGENHSIPTIPSDKAIRDPAVSDNTIDRIYLTPAATAALFGKKFAFLSTYL